MALQPSLGHLFSRVNTEWRKGYEIQTTRAGRWLSAPTLSHVVVVSVSGGIHDYQVLFLQLRLKILYFYHSKKKKNSIFLLCIL